MGYGEEKGQKQDRHLAHGALVCYHVPMKIKISTAISNEYWSRYPDDIPNRIFSPGTHNVTKDEAAAVLADAEFNADAKCGPEEMPAGVRRAYAALAKQVREAMA